MPPGRIGTAVTCSGMTRQVRILDRAHGRAAARAPPTRRGAAITPSREDRPTAHPNEHAGAAAAGRSHWRRRLASSAARSTPVTGEVAVRRILGVLALARKYGAGTPSTMPAPPRCDLGLPTYRFVRRYLERRPALQLSLKQIDPFIRELTQYRDLIAQRTQEEDTSPFKVTGGWGSGAVFPRGDLMIQSIAVSLMRIMVEVVAMLAEIFKPFIEKSPVSVMVRGATERLLSPGWVDRVFEQTADGQYTRTLLFSSVFGLMCQVVLGHRKSIHAAYMPNMEEIGVSITSVYNKLNGISTVTSAELVRDSAAQCAEIMREMGGERAAVAGGVPDSHSGRELHRGDANIGSRSCERPGPGHCPGSRWWSTTRN